MRRLLTLICSLLLAVGFIVAGSSAASAQDPVTIAPGDAWTTNIDPAPGRDQTNPATRDACTMAVVGTDSAGNNVGFSAAHCISDYPDGVPLYKWATTGPRTKIGTVAWRNSASDFVVFKFDAGVQIKSQGPRIRLDGIATTAAPFPWDVCKDGLNSGKTCGKQVYYNASEYVATNPLLANDSGGPGFRANTKWMGIGLATYIGLNWSRYVPASKVLSDVAAQSNPVGKGFTVVNN